MNTQIAKSDAMQGLVALRQNLARSVANTSRARERILGFCSGKLLFGPKGTAQSDFNLLKFFSLASFVVMVAVATVVVTAFQMHQSATLLRIAESQNSALARSFGNIIWLSHSRHLQSVGHLDGNALRAHSETREIDKELRKITSGLPVLKVKIYNPQGLTIYSSEPGQMGESKNGNAGFQQSASSGLPVSKMSYRGQFSAFSGIVAGVDLAETYVPLLHATGKLNVVFELYTDISGHVSSMRRDTWAAATTVLAGFVFIYLALLLVVLRADKTLRFQHRALCSANVELVTARRVTDDLNAALIEKVEALERSNQDLRDFAHVAAHDLEEPLRKIEAFGGRLFTRYGDTLPDEGRMFIERMQDASSRMRRLITDLLSWARVERGAQSFATVDLNEVVNGILSDLQIRIEETDAIVTVDKLPAIEANAGQMRQLFQNLVANALKFQKPGVKSRIEVAAGVENDATGLPLACITVTDNGIGFDNKYKDRIFKLFQRLHGRSEYEGTGVGLATCKRIVLAHQGTMDAKGRPGLGATFEMRIPVRQIGTS